VGGVHKAERKKKTTKLKNPLFKFFPPPPPHSPKKKHYSASNLENEPVSRTLRCVYNMRSLPAGIRKSFRTSFAS